MCVCVWCGGFYNLHLPKYSKFFQSVYYIYYLSHAPPVSISAPSHCFSLFSYVCFTVLAAPCIK